MQYRSYVDGSKATGGARVPAHAVLASCLALAACTGTVSTTPDDDDVGRDDTGNRGDGEPSSHDGGSSGQGGNGTSVEPELGVMAIRRLTKWEYENTIKDLLGAPASYAAAYPGDDVSKYGFATATNTSELMVSATMESADALSRFAMDRLDSIVPCAAAANDACAKQLIEEFGQRVFRRPLSATEKQELFELYSFARKDLAFDFRGAVRVLLTAMLQSPQFLYHWEVGDEPQVSNAPGTVELGGYQLASRLSYFLWGSMPDAALFSAAEDGSLTTADELVAQARRLLADPRARGMVANFFTQLLQLDGTLRAEKDAKSHPEWTLAMRTSAYAEARAFVQSVVLDGDGLWSTVMTAGESWIDAGLAKLYGVSDVMGTTSSRSRLPPEERAGILTQVAFLSAHSGPADGALVTPIHRGQIVRTRLLCQVIPPPAADVTAQESTGVTTRERLNSHVANPQCASCHALMDDLGFAFENYDVTGKWRTMDNGKLVDASGEISGLDSGTPTFTNALELAKALASAPEAIECAVSNLLRYGLGRIDTDGEASALLKGMGRDELDLREAMVAVVASPGFSTRLLAEGEVLP